MEAPCVNGAMLLQLTLTRLKATFTKMLYHTSFFNYSLNFRFYSFEIFLVFNAKKLFKLYIYYKHIYIYIHNHAGQTKHVCE